MKSTRLVSSFLCVIAATTAASCKSETGEESNAKQATSKVTITQALAKKMTIRVNQKTAMATLYRSGKPISKWKIATGRVQNTDENEVNPPDGSGQNPTGVFEVHELEACPPWAAKGKSFIGCDGMNPLGRKALWFQGTRHWGLREFGLHGVDQGHIDSVQNPSIAARRQSSGCVRNHPNNIESIFALALSSYARTSEKVPGSPKTERYTLKAGQEPVYVVSSNWDTDPAVPDVSGKGSIFPDAGTTPPPPPAGGFPKECKIIASSANVRASAAADGALVGALPRDTKVTVKSVVEGGAVGGSTKWYAVDLDGKAGHVHSSLVGCP